MSQNRDTLPQIVQIVIYAILEIIGSRESQQTTLIDAMEITHVQSPYPSLWKRLWMVFCEIEPKLFNFIARVCLAPALKLHERR